MSGVLHLSDLHLGKPGDHQWLDDHKASIAGSDRRAEKDVLRETIIAFVEDGGLQDTDAVVVSGDLTNRGGSDGFDEFAELMKLITARIAPEKILVVPGNHDVPREHGPGDPERYTEFLRVTRDQGFATPLLDGVDFDAGGALGGQVGERPHLVYGERFAIVPINSSHFCWGVEPLPDSVVEKLLSVDPTELSEATEALRRYDIPRVSNAQMTALEQLGGGLVADRRPSAQGRVVIGVLHHQLLPVSAREEFKSFESLTNLGAVREFLVSLGVQVVLHGHKHESALYWDYVADQRRLSAAPARMLVSAAAATFRAGRPVARRFQIGQRIEAAEVAIEDICAADRREGPIGRVARAPARLWDPLTTDLGRGARVITGPTASAVYARVQSVLDGIGSDAASHYLICEIENPADAARLPDDFPGADREERQRWMADLVEWWQLAEPLLGHGVDFNHGERIHRRWGDQVKRAASVLGNAVPGDPETTRAMILLLDPQTETSPATGVAFPSFVSIQLQMTRHGSGWRLECTGIFRKQEMRYWWPINVAELAKVQAAVARGVTISGAHPSLGLLRTVTAQAIAEDRLPAVAVPAVDRAVDQHPMDLWRMAFSLIDPGRASAAETLASWRHYLEDLRPTEGEDQRPSMSRRGLQRVLEAVQAVADAQAEAAIAALRNLVDLSRLIRDTQGTDPSVLRAQISERIDALEHELDCLFASADG